MPIRRLLNFKHKHAPKGSFKANVLTFMTGTAIAQLITVAVSPILTRLFDPEAFGAFGVYISLVSIATSISTLRYEQALMLPKDTEDSVGLFWASILSVCIISGISLVCCTVLFKQILVIFKIQKLSWWILTLPVSIFLSGVYLTLNSWSTRQKNFRRASISQVVRSAAVSGVQISSGIMKAGSGGLVGGAVAGYCFATAALGWQVKRDDEQILKKFLCWRKIKQISKQYRDFPIFSSTQNFLNAISQNIPLLLLAKFFGPAIAGFYALGVRVLQVPMSFISKSMRQVLFQKTSELYNRGGDTYVLFKRATISLLAVVGIPALVFILFGPKIFYFVLGEKWVIAGDYARWLTLWLCIGFVNVPAIIFYQVLRKQKALFIQDFLLLIFRLGALLLGGMVLKDPLKTVIIYSLVGAAFNLFFIINIARILKNRSHDENCNT